MHYVERNLGVNTADGERVHLSFDGDLLLSFVDWCEQPCQATFRDVLAFRWQELDAKVPRDDTTYEVVDSDWLAHQAKLQALDPAAFVHYLLCFNACGALDVICRRPRGPEEG
jgi:hypothetical protein